MIIDNTNKINIIIVTLAIFDAASTDATFILVIYYTEVEDSHDVQAS